MSASCTVRKEIFWHCLGQHGIHSQASHAFALLGKKHRSTSALPNDNECQNKNVLAHDFVYRFLVSKGQILQATGDTFYDVRRDSNPRILSFTSSKGKNSSGIHFGISSCTDVKELLKHCLEVTLQGYFTIPTIVFHGKKAANSYLSPQFNCFFSFSMTKFLKASEPITSTIGPKERILITISGSSS